jgi:squalene-hopene/tetraprenyl-beta-curcumene cyclase
MDMTAELRRRAAEDAAVDAGYGRREHHPDALQTAIDSAVRSLLSAQHPDGHWCYEFEADCTIPAEYILMTHFMGEVDPELEAKIGVYLRRQQADHGGWSLYYGDGFNISGSVKAYYALKLLGDDPEAPHMRRAREAILAHGGAVSANVFTHITLALFGQIPWRGVPFIPVEIMLLPRWFPFHISKVSYWSRTVMVPLFVLCTLKPSAKNPRGVHIRELFITPPQEERNYFPVRSGLNLLFLWLDRFGRVLEKLIPNGIRERALRRAEAWVIERLNGTGGLGAIFPAMVNAHEMLFTRGYPEDHPYRRLTKEALKRLLIVKDDHAYCQPCTSPVWDTALATLALREVSGCRENIIRGLDWLKERQLLDAPGDWRDNRPDLRGGGWPFQFENSHYPDIDDSSVVGWIMQLTDPERYRVSIERASEWIAGMQSSNGGFGAFDVDNTHYYLNEIPFADHGALLDPPTSDVTARCMTLLAAVDERKYAKEIGRALDFLWAEQEENGSWFGRWGTNYIYGTWSVLSALEVTGIPNDHHAIRRAVDWLRSTQRPDGGWGEDNATYFDASLAGRGARSTAFQTAWALLALMAAGEVRSHAVRRGIDYLRREQLPDGLWWNEEFTAPGFPRVFYLKYHGYTKYFPLWALARFRNLSRD